MLFSLVIFLEFPGLTKIQKLENKPRKPLFQKRPELLWSKTTQTHLITSIWSLCYPKDTFS